MKAALGCLAIGSVAGVFAFAGETRPVAAEILFVVGFVSGLALLFHDARATASNDLRRVRVSRRKT
jgi:hypothetical protein